MVKSFENFTLISWIYKFIHFDKKFLKYFLGVKQKLIKFMQIK
jgi:hypothetical protein